MKQFQLILTILLILIIGYSGYLLYSKYQMKKDDEIIWKEKKDLEESIRMNSLQRL